MLSLGKPLHTLIYGFLNISIDAFPGTACCCFNNISLSFWKINNDSIIVVFNVLLHSFLLRFADFAFFRHSNTCFPCDMCSQIWTRLFHLTGIIMQTPITSNIKCCINLHTILLAIFNHCASRLLLAIVIYCNQFKRTAPGKPKVSEILSNIPVSE